MKNSGQWSVVRDQFRVRTAGSVVLKGHDFSRAARALSPDPALAAEGMFVAGRNIPQGLKPKTFLNARFGTTKVVPFQNRRRESR